ncbi:CHAD domain-containing protein [Nocardia brasiliensis]|uniref:CHAD domain-containing protein n=1 Tax=Nocardia brasiliensis TaxID=37326 RepID=A0A6G9XP98_NOCBR|nr:CHAD domain-containing protein [Nocardia brasiliensis]QIS02745.1 CHAD domain-containing protein [Nocardia brasiliensis]
MTATAGNAIIAALRDDIDRLFAAEPEVRDDAPDSVHQMRVATRRLRSVLRSYRGLFERTPAAALGAELKWLAGVLGVARDAEVRAARFADLLTEHARPEEHSAAALAPMTARLVTAQQQRYTDAHAEVLLALDSTRYHDLRAELARWRTDPPLRTARAGVAATEFFGVVLQRDRERVERLIRLEPTVTADERVELLHDIRKSAKRLRYSCEAAEQVLAAAATGLGARAKRLQTVLGDHRDAVESQHALYGIAADAGAAGEDPARYRALAGAEEVAAHRALSRYPEAATALRADGE